MKRFLRPALLLFAVVAASSRCGFDFGLLAQRGGQFFFILKKMFPPDWGFLPALIEPLRQTAEMAFLGTLAGAVAALAFAPFCSTAVSLRPNLAAALRTLVNLLRTVPALVLALSLSFWLGTGSLTGVAALSLYSFGILARLAWEAMDLDPPGALEALTSSGCGRAKAFARTTLVRIMPGFAANALYILEANVRHAAILGYVGAGGLGLVLSEKLAWREYARAGAILMTLCAAVLLIEAASARLRAALSGERPLSPAWKRALGLILAAGALLCATRLSGQNATAAGFRVMCGLFGGLVRPNTALLFGLDKGGVPALLLETVCMAFAGTALGAALSLPLAVLSCRRFVPFALTFASRAFSAALRTVPAVVYGLLFIRVAGPGPFAGLLTFAALSLGMCVKLFTGVFDDLDLRPARALRTSGCPLSAVFARAVWPAARAHLAAASLYRFDVNLREASVMGLVGAGGIGTTLLFAMNGCDWPSAGACLLGLSVVVLTTDAVSSRLRRKALEK
jgi:phosphonate transport system permease protein